MAIEDILDYLNQVLGRKMYSMPAYILNASPYVEPHAEALWEKLHQIVDENQQLAQRIARAIRELEGVPAPGMRDHSSAQLNYLSLSFLSTQIVKSMEGDLRFMQEGKAILNDHPKTHQLIDELIEHDRSRYEELKALTEQIQQKIAEEKEAARRRKEEEERQRREAEEREKEEKREKARKAAAEKAAARKKEKEAEEKAKESSAEESNESQKDSPQENESTKPPPAE